jgi:hypothetical protein
MTDALDELLCQEDCDISPDAKIIVFDSMWEPRIHDACYHPTFMRTDMVAQTTHAFPVTMLGGSLGVAANSPKVFLRKTDGRELGSPHFWALEAWAEGQLWSEVACGTRLPSELVVLPGRRMPVAKYCAFQKLPVRGCDTWRGRLPFLTSHLWCNEALAGRKLLFGEVREGEDFLFRIPVPEDTPPKFYRIPQEFYKRLHSFNWD